MKKIVIALFIFGLAGTAQAQMLGGVSGVDKHNIIGFGVQDIFVAQANENSTTVSLTDNGTLVTGDQSLNEDGMVANFVHDFLFTAVQDTFTSITAALQLSSGQGSTLVLPLVLEVWNLGSDTLLASANLDSGFVPTATESVELFQNVTYVVRMSNLGSLAIPGVLGNAPDYTVNVFTPVPVPAAVWLFGTAMIGLFGLRRKSRMAVAA
jgi:hypothetical protein